MRKIVIAVLVLVFIGNTSTAMTGNELLQACGDKPNKNINQLISRMECVYYIKAIADAMQSKDGVHGARACIPPGVDDAQQMLIVYRYIYSNLDYRHVVASALVAAALTNSFPCR